MKNSASYSYLIALLLTIFLITPVKGLWAGGLYLNEFGTTSMGTAGAGANALAMDASTAFHNPAGMTRIGGRELMVSGGLLNATIEFDPDPNTPIPGNDGGNAGGLAPLLGAFYTHSLSDDWRLGLSLVSVSAALMDFDTGWTGRYYVNDVSIFTISAIPAVASRVNDWLSLGASANIL